MQATSACSLQRHSSTPLLQHQQQWHCRDPSTSGAFACSESRRCRAGWPELLTWHKLDLSAARVTLISARLIHTTNVFRNLRSRPPTFRIYEQGLLLLLITRLSIDLELAGCKTCSRSKSARSIQRLQRYLLWNALTSAMHFMCMQMTRTKDIGCSIIPDCRSPRDDQMYVVISCLFEEPFTSRYR